MSERVRFHESDVPPGAHAQAPHPYYFPAGSYPHGAAARSQQPPIPQGYQPGYQSGYPRPEHRQPAPPPAYTALEQAAFATLDEVVAQISARQRTLDGDSLTQPPFAAPPVQPYGADAYAPPPYRAPVQAPPLSPQAMPYPPEPPHYAMAAPPPPPPAPPVDLSGLESQLRNITAQIETLRQPVPDFSVPLRELRQDLAEIGDRLTEAMPRRAVEALEMEVRRLAERIDMSRAAGVDPQAVAAMDHSLNDLRDAIRSLKPAESLAGFEQAVRQLTDRIDNAGGAYQDPASLQQIESSIVALRGIVANVASNDTLEGLAHEVRGLSARVDQVASSARHVDSELLQSIEQRIANLPVLGAIERGFAELKSRLDSIPLAPPQPVIDPAPAVDFLKRDLVRTQDSLEAVHSTLGHLVDRLAMIEGGIREARLASQAPASPPRAPAPNADLAQFMQAAAQIAQPVAPALVPTAPVPPQDLTPPENREAPPAAKPKAPVWNRQPADSRLPHDFPLEPGSGTPKVRPAASAAERIAASEAVLGAAKPGSANHPGQNNFIAAARRAAQAAAAAAAPETPKAAKAAKSARAPVAAAVEVSGPAEEASAETPANSSGNKSSGKAMSQRMRKLLVGASVVVLLVAGGKLALDLLDSGHPSSANMPAPVFSDPVEEDEAPKSQAENRAAPAAAPAPAAVLPQAASNNFNVAPPSGVILPERPKPAEAAQAHSGPTGSVIDNGAAPIGNAPMSILPGAAAPAKDVSTKELSTKDLPPLPDKLPVALRNAASKGVATAQYEVGSRLIDGKAVPQNTEDGIRWLDRAAKAGIAPASFRLGGMYEKGIGVKKDLSAARRYYIAAAEKGHAKAMHNLAVLYAEGIDGKPDYRTAAEWFRRAADYGVADSQFNLGILFARGIGLDQNLAESYRWFALAALQGDQDAAKKRDEVGAKLDPATLAQARAAVQSFAAQPQPDDAVTVRAPAGGWDKPAAENAPSRKSRTGSVARLTAS